MIDREMEQKVWQRVRGQDSSGDDLARLLQLSRLQAEDLRQLDSGLYHREKLLLGLLTGLQYLISGSLPPAASAGSPGIPRRRRIQRCRDRCREMLLLCIRLENHPRYGALFTDLTRLQRAACVRLQQLT